MVEDATGLRVGRHYGHSDELMVFIRGNAIS
jgi:hypothetical protein